MHKCSKFTTVYPNLPCKKPKKIPLYSKTPIFSLIVLKLKELWSQQFKMLKVK